MKTHIPKSKTGLVIATLYFIFASILSYDAYTCSGWLCDLVALPTLFPFGFIYLMLLRWLDTIYVFGPLFSDITNVPFRFLAYLIPTLLVNTIIFYWFGVVVGKAYRKIKVMLGRK